MFTDKVDISAEDKVIEQLILGRKRANGTPDAEEDEEREVDDDGENRSKPN